MIRALKITFAFGCTLLGYILSFNPQSIFSIDVGWLCILSSFGFLLMMGAGLYGILKLARPFIYHLDEVNGYPTRR